MAANNKELNIDESVLQLLGYVKYVLKFLLKTIYIPILAAAILGYLTYKKQLAKPDSYGAFLTFIKTSDLNSNALPSIGIQGISLGGSSSGSGTNNQEEILKSDLILSKALFKPLKGQEKLLINQYIDVKFPDSKDNYFTHPEIDSLSDAQRRLYKVILADLKSDESSSLVVDAEEVTNLGSRTGSPELSAGIVRNIFEALSEFYDLSSSEKVDENLTRIRKKRDSTRYAIQGYRAAIARISTKSSLDAKPTDQLRASQLADQMEQTRLMLTKFESDLQNYELQVADQEATFQLLNAPIEPISANPIDVKGNTIKMSIVGFFLGIMLALFLLVLTKFIYFFKKA